MSQENLESWSDQDIAQAYEQGASMKAIAARLGIAPATARKTLRRLNVATRPARRPPLPEEAILGDYKEGSSTTELGRSYGVSAETIRRILLKHNTQIRPAHHSIATTANYRQPMSDDQRAQAVELYRQGLSAAQVAEQMGFASKRTILNVVNAAGVTRAGTRGTVEADLKSPAMQEIARRYQSGEKIQSLAQEYGIARSTLQRRLSALKLRG